MTLTLVGMGLMVLLHSYGGGGLLSGFLHPLLGLDHLLAMLAVGVLSAQIGGRAIWTVPATFVIVMAVGAVLGIVGVPIPFVEFGIVASVIVLGVAIVANRRVPEWAAIVLVAMFALFHGHAHGTELPALTDTVGLMIAYIAGFLIATAGLHVIGALIGMSAVRNPRGTTLLRASGVLIAAMGVFLLVGA